MRNLIIGIVLGLSMATAGAWAFDNWEQAWAQQQQQQQLQQQERWNQEQFRQQQQFNTMRPPC